MKTEQGVLEESRELGDRVLVLFPGNIFREQGAGRLSGGHLWGQWKADSDLKT
jgi:hypothetical protein